MEPAIAVDAEGFAGILLEFGRAVDGLEKREKAWGASQWASNCSEAGQSMGMHL